jgi:peptidyl-prolyl cis-trans isomerase D
MISFLRSIINSRVGAVIALAFVVLLGIGFVLGDVTGKSGFGGLSGANVAKVGGEPITLSEFNQAMENRLRAERKNNPTLDMARFVDSGGLDATLEQLINRYALAVFGEKYGVAVSKRLVDYEIRKIPGSNGLDGKYSEKAFRAFLGNMGLTEKMVRDDFTQNLFAQQVLPTTVSGPGAPMGIVLPYASLVLEKRSGQLAIVPSVAFLPQAVPSEAELSTYYKANAIKFTIPEKRAISYAMFDSNIVADRAKPNEADIAAYYKTNSAQYAANETRDIAQVIVPTQAAAQALSAKIAQGQSIAAAASTTGLSVTSTKAVTRQSLTTNASKAVADAVFATAQGGVATPSKGGLGWYVVKVDGVKQIAARPLASVSADIAAQLATSKKEEALIELTSEIEDEFSGGATITDIAKANGLKVETSPKLLANGINPASRDYRPIPEFRAILPAAFQMETDGKAQLIEIVPGKQFALVSVADFEEAAPPPLASVRDDVFKDWALAQGSKKAKIAAEGVRKAISGGKSMSEALALLGVKLPPMQTVSGTRAELNKDGKTLSPPLALLFSMVKGSAKTLQAPNNGGWLIIQATEVIKGDASKQPEMLAARKTEMSGILSQEYAAQLVLAAANDVGVKRNDAGIAELRARLTKKDAGN